MRNPEYFTGKPIKSMQTMLRFISLEDPNVLPVIPGGTYDSSTYASVISFQSAYDLQPSGAVDQFSWQTIVRQYDRALPFRTIPTTRPSWSSEQTAMPGQFNYHIYLVQAMLTALSDFFSDLDPPDLTGTLDPVTQSGLQYIQAASRISETGELNTATWNYLNAIYGAMVKDGNK